MPPEEIDKATLFRELGYAEHDGCEEILAAAGLTNARKSRIRASKREQARLLLEAALFKVCNRGDCRVAAKARAGPREIVSAAAQHHCEICSGSINQSAVDDMAEAARRAGVSRICVVGGSPAAREELRRALGDRLEFRGVDGTLSHTRAQAQDNARWAGLVVIWGSTELDHRVSTLYRGPNVVVAPKRGVADLAAVARAWLERRPRGM